MQIMKGDLKICATRANLSSKFVGRETFTLEAFQNVNQSPSLIHSNTLYDLHFALFSISWKKDDRELSLSSLLESALRQTATNHQIGLLLAPSERKLEDFYGLWTSDFT
jgi:hypothetical protein